jgi:hypothetical protein
MEATETPTTVQIAIAGVTRTVELGRISTWDNGDSYTFVHGVVATIGRGSARYADTIRLVSSTKNFRTNKTTDSNGTVWQYHLNTCVRNHQARIVGWADQAPATNEYGNARVAK